MRTASAPILVCLVLIASLGVVHGVYTDRWGPSGELEQALGALERVPMKVGDWTGEDVPYEAEALARAGIKGGVFRRYTNKRTRESISLLIVCGRGGPLSVHTPDICYSSAGYKQLAPEERKESIAARDKKIGFALPVLESQRRWFRAVGDLLVLVPRWFGMAGSREPAFLAGSVAALYKLYVVREYTPKSRSESSSAGEDFVRQFFPVLRRSLPTPSSS